MIKIKYANLLIRDFSEKDINTKFINSLNNKNLNKFLSTRKSKQYKKDALKYLIKMRSENHIYLAVIDEANKNLIGTITFREHSKHIYFLGYMVCDINYIGGYFFFKAVNKIIKLFFEKFKVKKIIARTNKKNLASNFFLIKLGFNLKKKHKNYFSFSISK
jgi:RimJ/RimL family protein N-acetyltransferase